LFYEWHEGCKSYVICSRGGTCNNEEYPDEYSMPTHQMAMKWLREVHNVMIVPIPISFKKKSGYNKWKCELYIEGVFEHMNSKFSTYEEACEAALKHCLINLLK